MGDLYRRLKRLKKQQGGAGRRSTAPGSAASPGTQRAADGAREPDFSGLDTWRRVAPLVFVRETEESLPHAVRGSISSRLLGRVVSTDELCFMDTETTGLSGGAGTTVFLVGGGVIKDGVVRVSQALLADFPGEPEFLEEVARMLGRAVWVSYNGKAFDARLLESRFLMNGRPPLAPEQLDLLYWSRRLWKHRLERCSLGDVERGVLERGRRDDIPGIEIPDRYFRFLAERDASGLGEVFEHHRLDIVSLVHLFLRIEDVLRDPISDGGVDAFRLGRWLLRTGDERGIDLLERAALTTGSADAIAAACLVSRTLRRRGEVARALGLLERSPSNGELPIVVERAKLFEHDLRDPGSALETVEAYLRRSGEPATMPELERRLERLRRKVGRP
ncbi:MAG: ribonuclease H-like domain-containing protein [Spirochaetota bacterium]